MTSTAGTICVRAILACSMLLLFGHGAVILQGNLVYRMTEQNFNKAMATAADIVVAEVEHIVSCW